MTKTLLYVSIIYIIGQYFSPDVVFEVILSSVNLWLSFNRLADRLVELYPQTVRFTLSLRTPAHLHDLD